MAGRRCWVSNCACIEHGFAVRSVIRHLVGRLRYAANAIVGYGNVEM